MKINRFWMLGACVLGALPLACVADQPAKVGRPSASQTPAVTRVRFFPRSDFPAAATLVGAKFQGSNQSQSEGFVDLATISDQPADNAWTEIAVKNAAPYRFLRFVAPNKTWQGIGEVEFYAGDQKLSGVPFGSRGSYYNLGNTFAKAFDGDPHTFYDWPAWSAVAGIDTQGDPAASPSAPTALAATFAAKEVDLSWLSSPGATAYTIKRAAGSGKFATLAHFDSSDATVFYRDTTAKPNHPYSYIVTAQSAHGESGDSAPITPASLAMADAKAAPKPLVTICPLGDSITGGGNAPGGYRVPLFDKLHDAGYHVDFVGTLREDPPAGSGHEGHGGWEATQLAGIELPPHWESQEVPTGAPIWLSKTRPDFVLVMAGTNDMLHSKPDAGARAVALVDRVHQVLPDARIIVAQIVMNGFTSTVETANHEIADAVQARAAKGWKVSLADMQHPLSYPADFADGVHPTKAGYAKMADVWFAALTPFLQK